MDNVKNEMFDKFDDLHIAELINILVSPQSSLEEKEQVNRFICTNFCLSPQFQMKKSLKSLERKNISPVNLRKIKLAKDCAIEIVSDLLGLTVETLYDITNIAEQRVQIAKSKSDW